jgi:hypothetical protein
MPLLVVERGNDKGLSVKIEPAKAYVVGRENSHAAVKLSDPMASRAHFQISSQNGSWRVKDMKSRNGTLLNDEQLLPDSDTELKIGDKIQVGETIFSFLSDEKEETAGGLIGKTIGGYQLIERVGRGGMGTVYKAEQISLKRVVALKVLSAKLLSDPVFVERFVQEARAAGGLTHPNIVQVIDVGSDRGIYYFSMEFMDNGSVGDVVAKEGPVPWERALAMLTDAARGLIFAEKKGIIHRDIKPDNLMLTSEGAVKIGDLGLAKKAEDVAGEGGQIFGTPHFIAPEQAQGKPVDNRADIYALGATFYRVLSGKTPFTGENVKEILLKQIQQEPEPIEKVVPDLPEEMAAVLGKMMKKRADDRYRSAQGLFEDLERIRVSYHLEARGQARSALRTKWLAAVLFLAVLGLGGVVYHFVTMAPPKAPPPVYLPGPTANPTNVGPSITPEQKADIAYSPLSRKYADLFEKFGGGPAATWKKHGPEWLALADELEKVAKENPGTGPGTKAGEDAAKIRKDIGDARAAWDTKSEKLKADRAKATADANSLVAGGKYAEAVAKLKRETDALLNKDRDADEILGGNPRKAAKDEILALIATARTKAEALEKAAVDAAPKFPGPDYLAAFFALDALRTAITPAETAKVDPSFDPSRDLREIAAKIVDTLRTTRATAEEFAREAIDQDEAAFFNTYLRIRRLAPSIASGFEESQFFAFKWDDAIALWTALRKEQKTQAFQDRVDAKIAQYQRCKRIFQTIAQRIKAGKLVDPDFPKSVKKGSNIILDGTVLDKATPDGCWVLRVPSREKVFVEFREMTPDELYDLFLKSGANLPLGGEDHLDLAVFLAEAGSGASAGSELGASQQGQTPAAEGNQDPLYKWVQAECILSTNYHSQDGIASLKLHYDQAKKDGASMKELEQRRTDIETRAAAMRADEKYYTSDLSILFLSEMGTASPVPDRLLPVAVTDEIVRTLGVKGSPGLPKEDETAPPPPGGGGDDGGLVPNPGGGKKDTGNPPPPPAGGEKEKEKGSDGTEKPK